MQMGSWSMPIKRASGSRCGALYKVRSLTTAKIQVKVLEGLAACGRTGLAPISGISLGVCLNRIGVAFQALLEHKVLRRANVDGSHEAPWS